MDYARYNSATNTHLPPVAGGPPELPPNNVEEIGRLLQEGIAELQAMQPGPAQVGRHNYLMQVAGQLQGNIADAWAVPGAWMGLHQQVVQFRGAVMDLQASPFNVGDNYQGVEAPQPMLSGLGQTTAASQQKARKDRNVMVIGTLAAMVVVAGAFGLLDAPKGRGTRGVGSPHGLRVKFHNPKFPGAKKAK